MGKCVFCRIVDNNDKAVVVYENLSFVAFMDRHPANPGHVLVIPKRHYAGITSMPVKEVGKLYSVTAIVARAAKKATAADGVNLGQSDGRAASQEIFHAHVHVLPRFSGDAPPGRWPGRKEIPQRELRRIGELIRKEISRVTQTP